MFIEKDVATINENFINDIAKEWMLVSAGNEDEFNMMTASWGFVGEMWGKHAAICAIRPQRYTKKFVDENEYFALSFYGDGAQKTIHQICGKKSGRDTDKAKEANLTPIFSDNTVYFDEARLVLICKKIYTSKIEPEKFLDKSIDKWYDNDYHEAYIGEIVKCYVKE